MSARTRRVAVIVAIVVAALIPFALNDFVVSRLNVVLAYTIALMGLDLLVGYSGQISLGHGAFYAIGAYVAAVAIGAGLDPLIAIPLAAAVTFCAGFAFGVPALRLRGIYLSLATLALAVVMPALFKRVDALGGVGGMGVNRPVAPFALPLSTDKYIFAIACVLTVLLAIVARNLTRGRLGRAFAAVRENEHVAVSMGVSLTTLKVSTFAIGSMFAGIAGALSAIAIGFVAPDSFSFLLSLTLLAAIVVGGLRSIGGAVCGAIFLQAVPFFASSLAQSAPAIVFGGTMIAVVLFLPRGIYGTLTAHRPAKEIS